VDGPPRALSLATGKLDNAAIDVAPLQTDRFGWTRAGVRHEPDKRTPPAAFLSDALDLGPRFERDDPLRADLRRRLHLRRRVRRDNASIDTEPVDHPKRASDIAPVRLPDLLRREAGDESLQRLRRHVLRLGLAEHGSWPHESPPRVFHRLWSGTGSRYEAPSSSRSSSAFRSRVVDP
jgi:hypothetical protein